MTSILTFHPLQVSLTLTCLLVFTLAARRPIRNCRSEVPDHQGSTTHRFDFKSTVFPRNSQRHTAVDDLLLHHACMHHLPPKPSRASLKSNGETSASSTKLQQVLGLDALRRHALVGDSIVSMDGILGA